MAKVLVIEGIGEASAKKLQEAGVKTVEALLAQGASANGRKEIAEKTGISGDHILTWVNHADLFRVKGIAAQYSELLEAAGVDSVPELAQRKAENLLAKLVAINQEKKRVRKLPTQSQIADWIEQAKQLPRVVTH